MNAVSATTPLQPRSTREGSRRYAIAVCVFASLGGMYFGYDQGVTGGVLVMDSFLDDFCVDLAKSSPAACRAPATQLPASWLTFTAIYNIVYYLGCIVGAFAGGYVADRCGRRVTCFLAAALFCVGTLVLVLTPAHARALLLAARVLQGMGVGNSSFSLPLFGAEMAPKELRGLLSGFMQMMVVTGLLLANVINVAVEHVRAGWRITNAIAMLPPVVVMLGIFCVPESPRWVYAHRGRNAARADLTVLRMTDDVTSELDAIGEQIAAEGDSTTWRELCSVASVRRRIAIAMALQLLQQATGVNAVFTYGGQIFKDVVGDGVLALLILTVVNFASTVPAMRWVDSMGRRQLLLLGAAGMCVGHVVAAIAFTVGCRGTAEDAGCSTTAGYVIVAATAFFVFNFAVSWGPVCWIYPPEIFPLAVRARAVSLSTMTNWATGALMLGVAKLLPTLNVNGIFFLFAALCAGAGAFVSIMCPETKGLLLEDIDVLFGGVAAPSSTALPNAAAVDALADESPRAQTRSKYAGAETPRASEV